MAENFILTLMIKVLAFPFVTLSLIAEVFNFWNIRTDIGRCLNVIDSSTDIIPPLFIVGLIAAEDHRNALHPGVDPIAMVRAGLVRIRHKKIEGASTIEQQFVRTVAGRYERSLQRKISEQSLAISVLRRRSKSRIANAYLSIAFYGPGCVGLVGLKRRCGDQLEITELSAALGMIARLKYPEPIHPTKGWRDKIDQRVQYINRRKTACFPASVMSFFDSNRFQVFSQSWQKIMGIQDSLLNRHHFE